MTGGEAPRVAFCRGWRLALLRGRFLFACARYLCRPRRYPLFTLGAREGGVLHALRQIRRFRIPKPVRFEGTYRVSIAMPRWPSRAFDDMVARGGLNLEAAGSPRRAHVDFVILAITRRCGYSCAHCYERDNIAARESVPLPAWRAAVEDLQKIGAGVIVLSGGEPMLRYADLLDLVRGADKDRSELHLNTSGWGVTSQAARELKAAGLSAAGIGVDDADPECHDAIRGFPGAHAQALRAAALFREAGVFPYFNVCLRPDLVRSGRLWSLLEMGRRAGVGILRLLEPKPIGGFLGRQPAELFSASDRAIAEQFLLEANSSRRYAGHPLIAYPGWDEAPERLGCWLGGLGHFAIDSRGNVNPCVFLAMPFGNITKERLIDVYARMRAAFPRPLRSGCPANGSTPIRLTVSA